MIIWRRIGFGVVGALALIGCSEDGALLAPRWGDGANEAATVLAALECRVEPGAGSMTCMRVEPGSMDGPAATVLGGQGTYISLESSNVTYEDEIFSADVTVRNLLTQSLGTADGAQLDEEGVRIFFIGDPVAVPAAAGPVTLQNADGTAVFTRPDQPFFRYPQALGPGRTSLPRNWRWHVPDGVDSFTFSVYVAAAVAREDSILAGLQIDPQTISGGEHHTCALTLDGRAYCWGDGSKSQLGNGSNSSRNRPVAVSDPDDGPVHFASISAGGGHTCALTIDGKAYCWGLNGDGELGIGATGAQNKPVAVVDPEGDSPQYTSITTGYAHTCALATTGKIYCWGYNSSGMLGIGTNVAQNKPMAVLDTIDGGIQFAAVEAGYFHTCALSTAGRAYCWGSGSNGRLGNGGISTQRAPVAVAPPEGEPDPLIFASISGGYEFTCGLTIAGKAYCWGRDNNGQLGNGELENQDKPVAVADPPDGATKYTSIATGSFHTCALTTTGKVYCWGNGEYGQLGDGNSGFEADRSEPMAVLDPTSGAVQFTSLTTGNSHTCGVTTSGQAYCWGHYSEGQLGVGPGSQHKTRPTAVLDPTGGPAMLIASLDPVSNRDRAGVGGGVNYCGADGILARLDKGRARYTHAPLRRLPLLAYLGEGVGHA